MDDADRRELDRLLDLAEMEELMQFTPEPASVVVEDRLVAADGLVVAADEMRRTRERLMPDSEWIGE